MIFLRNDNGSCRIERQRIWEKNLNWCLLPLGEVMSETNRNVSLLVWGVILILFGLLFLLRNWIDFRMIFRFVWDWWPLALVAFGLWNIYRYIAARN